MPLRVTFYARVSSDKDELINSLENQIQYYIQLIRSKPNWTYIEGCIDEGISGTNTKKRDSFNRMIRDAKAGWFDFIITKEISRFSRSTLDSDSEFCLVVMAGVAQNEVHKLSERLKFGFQQAMSHQSAAEFHNCYPYNGKIVCEEHAASFYRQVLKSGKGEKEVWRYRVYRNRGRAACSAPQLKTTELDPYHGADIRPVGSG